MRAQPVDPAQFPILGEPLPIELANTLYRSGGHVTDFLASGELIAAWFAHAPEARGHVPTAATIGKPAGCAAVRELRDAVNALCDHLAGNASRVPASAVGVLNRFASGASSHVELQWKLAADPRAVRKYSGAANHVFLAGLALAAIEFFAGPDRLLVRRCATPVCELFFVQHHHRRNFCSEPCSQRTRQARYYKQHVQHPTL
jgi:predicted RNA-binding Zn ribbon-like protein